MHITAIMAMSVNGRLTRGSEADITAWTSPDDKAQFSEELKKTKLLIMGSKTYRVHPGKTLSKDRLRVILTADPASFAADSVPGQREFHGGKPAEVINKLVARGYKKAVLLGGAATNRDFFAAGLVNELLLTIEPKLFGKGRPLIDEAEFNAELKLVSCKQLNDKGTLLLRYLVTPEKV